MRSLLTLGRVRGAAWTVDGRGAGVTPAASSPVRGSWGVRAAMALVAMLAVFGLSSALALAASLETPQLTVESVGATAATLHGVLNPNATKPSEAGTYEFLYKSGKAGCLGGSKAPQPAGMMTGSEHEEVYEGLSGLAADTEYTVCLRAVNTTSSPSEEATSPAVTFTTAISPETPVVVSPVKSVTATTATLEGLLNPHAVGNPGSYEFLYRSSAAECEGGEASGGSALGHKEEAVKAEVTLLPNTTYTFCLRAHNEGGEASALSAPVTFTTPVAEVVIEGESSSNVDATEARLEATIDPGNSESAYHFEYGPAAGSYDVSIPAGGGKIAPHVSGVSVSAVATGLTPGSSYHYRIVASNALPGQVDGADETFATPVAQETGSTPNCPNEQRRAEQPYASPLPDCRAYEMVSPLETNGQDATDSFIQQDARASVSGEAVTYASEGAFAEPTGETGESQFVSRRGSEGWSTQAVTPLHDPSKSETNSSYETDDFTSELTWGIANSNAALTDEAPTGNYHEDLYLADFDSGSYRYIGEEVNIMGSSVDLSHAVFGVGPVFEWVNGSVTPVDVSNAGTQMSASVGAAPHYNTGEDLWHAVSSDGSRVYFTTPAHEQEEGSGGLYVRVNAEQLQSPMAGEECTSPVDACTIEVSASQRATLDPHGPQRPRYWGASADGSKVFFTSRAELTDDAYTGPKDNAANLYEYELSGEAGKPGRLKDLTVDNGDIDGATVLGVAQISEGGSYVYFVAEGVLGAGAVAGEPNMYVSHEGGAPEFIATLATGDYSDWHAATYEGESGPENNTVVVTPSGNRLAFISEESLTGYDNEQAEPGQCETGLDFGGPSNETGRCREVFLYDAETDGLVCASCDPSGARPVGSSSFTPRTEPAYGLYRVRNLIEGGTLFFDSADALVPHASDGRLNVYEYEDGHVYPISDVAGGYESFFLDASPNGNDVFFGTADQLLPQDTSNNVVVYDARVGGGFPVSVAPPSCKNGDSCKPPPAPAPGVFGAPGSATFSGPGNIVPVVVAKPVVRAKAKSRKCKKGYEKKKGKCVRKHKSKKMTGKSNKRARKSSDRRGSK